MTTRAPSSACSDFEQDLVLYHYTEASADESRRIESHLQSCAGCNRFLQELAELLPLTLKEDAPPAEFWKNYSNELRRKLIHTRSARWKPLSPLSVRWPVPAAAAALLLAVGLTLTLDTWRNNGRDLPPENQVALEVLPIAENIDFFNSMDVLDTLDLLESPAGFVNGLVLNDGENLNTQAAK